MPGVNDNPIPDDSDTVVPVNLTIQYHTSCNCSYLTNLEGFSNFHIGNDFFLIFRFQHTFHRSFDFFNGIVNNRIQADIYLLLLSELTCTRRWPNLEADNDGIRSRGQQYI